MDCFVCQFPPCSYLYHDEFEADQVDIFLFHVALLLYSRTFRKNLQWANAQTTIDRGIEVQAHSTFERGHKSGIIIRVLFHLQLQTMC